MVTKEKTNVTMGKTMVIKGGKLR